MGSERVVPRIPVVELSSEKLKTISSSWNSACQEVREALEKYGCFELIYNKYSIANQNAILEANEQFFKVSDAIKTKYTHPHFGHGYYGGKSSLFPIAESAKIVNATDKQECRNFTDLMWPHRNQHFYETFHSEAMLLAEMQELVVKMLFESYGLDKEYIKSHIKSTSYLMLIHKYERSNQADSNLGLMGHTDKSFLSILHQNHVKGLEIRLNDGEGDHWIFYEPYSHSSFIVLASDVCMGWSNDRIKSCYHRVVVEGQEVRYSVGLFGFMKGLIETPKKLVDEKHALKYKPFDNQEFVDFYNFDTNPKKFEINNLKAFCGI
ncbi:2-oxoglutarate (2OG) and Fe(II)-dependent oxygenase superfamily protein [Euphorbia peplus]|nr:2-oxoglutarate (2OG) and Fe(II)-dependent oxygenase superfamily protein [Euphorbia peplus]